MGESMRGIFVDIYLPFLKKHKQWIILHTVLMVVLYTVQTLLIPRSVTRLAEITISGTAKKNLMGEVRMLVGYFVVLTVVSHCKNMLDTYLWVDQFSMIRRMLYDKMLLFLETSFRSVRIGEFITVMSYLPREIRYVSDSLLYVFPGLVGYLLIVGTTLWVEWRAGLVLLVGLVGTLWCLFYSPLTRRLVKECEDRTRQQLETNSGVAEDIVQLDQIIGTNRTQNKMQENTGREDHLQRDFQAAANTANTIYVVLQTWNLMIFVLAGFVMYRYKNKDGRGHALRTYVVVMSSFLGILWTFIARSTVFITASAITEIYYKQYLAMVGKAEGQDLTAPASSPSQSSFSEETRWTEIRWEKVSFRYTETSPMVFSELDWTIPARSRWILEGPSGRGKSTILKLLMRFYAPSDGKILIDGQPVDTMEVRRLRRNILYVNQDTPLFHQTILDNIRNSHHEITYDLVRDTLTKYRLLGILAEDKQDNRNPVDAEAVLSRSCGVDGKNLSKGQQKIISLSRSMIHVPLSTQVLLLDEPLASLDPQSRQGVLTWIGDLLEQRPDLTVLMTTHVMEDQEWVRRHRFQSFQPWR